MLLRHFFTPGLFINSYLIFDEETRFGAVVDPTRQIEWYLTKARQEGIKIMDIIETHVHADFISGAQELKAALGGKATIRCSGLGGSEWIPSYADHLVKDRDAFHLGAVRLEAWHTPGHTPEHLIWVVYDEHRSVSVPEIAFTGDLLFVGSVGRPDLLGDAAKDVLIKQLYQSLFAVLHTLPDFVEIYPAHGAGSLCGKAIGMRLSSTLGYEKRCNPGLIPQDYNKWVKSLDLDSLPIPDYFSRMKARNVKGPEFFRQLEMPLSLTIDQVKNRSESVIVVDFRWPDAFAEGNMRGSINIPFAPSLSLWAASVLPLNKELLLVIDRPEMIYPIIQALSLVGLEHIIGTVNVAHWSAGDKKELFRSSPMMDVETLKSEFEHIYLLDVRQRYEWEAGHIEGAHHLELIKAAQQLSDIPIDKPVAVICQSGNRASIIASLLEKERGAKTFNIKGGMQAWNQAKGIARLPF